MNAFQPWLLTPGTPAAAFPDPRLADAEGLCALGGDLRPERLLAAYRRGIFPWYEPGILPLWWSPDPRGVLPLAEVHVPRRLRRTLRRLGDEVELRWNTAFREVMTACADRPEHGTWILPEMIVAYAELQARGHAHSLEVYRAGRLVGGIYGVQVGALFAAESMFHRETDMSKVALVALTTTLRDAGVELLDAQFETEHLARFGVRSWPRARYLAALTQLADRAIDLRDVTPRHWISSWSVGRGGGPGGG